MSISISMFMERVWLRNPLAGQTHARAAHWAPGRQTSE
jgi:hypothetical protein